VKYEILDVTEVSSVQDYEDYIVDAYIAPSVNTVTTITYMVNDIELQAKHLSNIGRLQVYKEKVSDWRKCNDITKISSQVVSDAIEDTKQKIVGATVDGVYHTSDESFICMADKDDKYAWESYQMICKRYKNPIFVRELDKQRGIPIKEYDRAYLYQHTSETLISCYSNKLTENDAISNNIAYRLLETYYDKIDGRSVSTLLDVLSYSEYLFEVFNHDCKAASNIIKDVMLSHNLWDSLTPYEIMEAVQIIDEDERDGMTIESVSKLCREES
jgi:hypothetical protein